MNGVVKFVALAVAASAWASTAQAQVVIETVTVGNPGNAGENSGESEPGGSGSDRICGSVDYVYHIGKFEVTAGQYAEFLNAVAATDTYGLYNSSMDLVTYPDDRGCAIRWDPGLGRYVVDADGDGTEDADWVDRPVNYVSWGDAARFANWLHNGQPGLVTPVPQDEDSTEDGSYYLNGAMSDAELLAIDREPDATWVIPSEDEWYKAAYHKNDGVTGNYYDYPTSGDSVPISEGCSDGSNSANYYDGAYAIGPPFYRNEVGCYVSSDSPYGAFDQGGNVWEWSEAVIESYRGIRGGGAFSSHGDLVYLHAAWRDHVIPPQERYYFGFRVAMFADCNDNGIPDECDLDCEATFGLNGWLCSDVYPVPTCGQSTDTDADGVPDECDLCPGYDDAQPCPIPAVSEWGLAVMTLLVLTAGTLLLVRRRAVTVG